MNKLHLMIWIFLGIFSSQAAIAEIYQWRDEKGKLHFSDKPPKKVKVENVDMDNLLKKSQGVRFSDPDAKPKAEEEKEVKVEKKKKAKDKSYKLSKRSRKCNRYGNNKCYYPEDEILCLLRYGVPCEEIHFWKTNTKEAYKRRTGENQPNPYYVLANRPMGLIQQHLNKKIPTHRNTSKRNLKCLKRHGFYCDELTSLTDCYDNYDMSCKKLRSWKDDVVEKCKANHGVDCESGEYLKNYRPLSIEEYNRSAFVAGSRDELLIHYELTKDDPKKYKKVQVLIDRFDGN